MSIVNQSPDFFGRSIRENLQYGSRRKLTDEEIMEAARVANAHEFIKSFRGGLDVQVSDTQTNPISLILTALVEVRMLCSQYIPQ